MGGAACVSQSLPSARTGPPDAAQSPGFERRRGPSCPGRGAGGPAGRWQRPRPRRGRPRPPRRAAGPAPAAGRRRRRRRCAGRGGRRPAQPRPPGCRSARTRRSPQPAPSGGGPTRRAASSRSSRDALPPECRRSRCAGACCGTPSTTAPPLEAMEAAFRDGRSFASVPRAPDRRRPGRRSRFRAAPAFAGGRLARLHRHRAAGTRGAGRAGGRRARAPG
ncbi:MAG: hypothetical protein MZV64_48640 [Ignavibacteriales bacterium]|nr:hypothetical protein [Ignavibacteriales bacterium]